MKRSLPKPVLLAIITVQTVSAVLAWRDLTGRPDDAIRGTKKVWRVVIAMNPGNSLAYWFFGRR